MLRKTVALLLSIMCISSCALANFETEYLEFYQEAIKRNCMVFPVNAYFSRLEPGIAGYCIPGFGILFNEDRWAAFGPYQRKELVFHELGHCVLGLEHKEPGLMSPVMHQEKDVAANWDAWLNVLFENCEKWPPLPEVTPKPK